MNIGNKLVTIASGSVRPVADSNWGQITSNGFHQSASQKPAQLGVGMPGKELPQVLVLPARR
jgi:hypothetical protein